MGACIIACETMGKQRMNKVRCKGKKFWPMDASCEFLCGMAAPEERYCNKCQYYTCERCKYEKRCEEGEKSEKYIGASTSEGML